MKLGKILCVALLCMFAAGMSLARAGEAEPSDSERLSILLERSYEPELELKLPAVIRFAREDDTTPHIVDTRFNGSKALAVAATWYAASTLDFDVTMHDLMDNGFWPWDWFPVGLDPDMPFGNFGVSGTDICGRELLEWIVLNRDDPRWVMDARYTILRASYELLYREQQIENFDALVRLPQFWFNELEGRSMLEGDADGDYGMVDPFQYQLFSPAFSTNQPKDPQGRSYPLLNFMNFPGPVYAEASVLNPASSNAAQYVDQSRDSGQNEVLDESRE